MREDSRKQLSIDFVNKFRKEIENKKKKCLANISQKEQDLYDASDLLGGIVQIKVLSLKIGNKKHCPNSDEAVAELKETLSLLYERLAEILLKTGAMQDAMPAAAAENAMRC